MRRTLLAVAVALLTVTAGCQGLPGGGSVTPGDDTTSTATPSPTPTAAEPAYPPGVSADGIENRSRLFEAGNRALNDSAYELSTRSNISVRTETGRIRQLIRTTVREEGGDGRSYQRNVLNHSLQGNRTWTVWSNGSVTLVRTWKAGAFRTEPEIGYRTAPSRDAAMTGRSGSEGMFLILLLTRFEVADHAGGTTTLTASGVNESAFDRIFGANGTVEELSAELVVDERGRVRSFDGTLVADPGENGSLSFQTVSIRSSWSLSLRDVDVGRPGWVPTALDAVTVADVAVELVDGRYVKLTNRGPDTIPAGASVTLEKGDTGYAGRLEEPLAPGETAYAYRPADAGGTRVARERPEAAARDLDGSYRLVVRTRNGTVANEPLGDDG